MPDLEVLEISNESCPGSELEDKTMELRNYIKNLPLKHNQKNNLYYFINNDKFCLNELPLTLQQQVILRRLIEKYRRAYDNAINYLRQQRY